MSLRDQMDTIYRSLPLDEIPWNMTEPPAVLRDLVERGGVEPGRAVDLGCGAGNYSIYLSRQGFDVTGVDLSPEAIALAERHAREEGVTCRFVAADLLADTGGLGDGFAFAFEWEVLHHVMPAERERYLDNVRALLAPGGRYLAVCFSDQSPAFGGTGQRRTTPLGTELYFSSVDELRQLYAPRFEILELDVIEVPGKHAPHLANLALLKRT